MINHVINRYFAQPYVFHTLSLLWPPFQ